MFENTQNEAGNNVGSVTEGLPKWQPAALAETRAAILAHRNKVGARTVKGGLLSNVAELTEALEKDEPRPWATHPMQTPQGLMGWQIERLKGISVRQPIFYSNLTNGDDQ